MCRVHDHSLAVHGTTHHTHYTAQISQMPIGSAIYGYEFTREFIYRSLRFIPRHESAADSHRGARDLKRYNLTGVVLLDSYDDHQMFCLEAVLSFVEHLDVLISDPTELPVGDYFSVFPAVARTTKRHDGGGAVLNRDTFFPACALTSSALQWTVLRTAASARPRDGTHCFSRLRCRFASDHRTSKCLTSSCSQVSRHTFASLSVIRRQQVFQS